MSDQLPSKKLVSQLLDWASHIHSARSEEKELLIRAARELQRIPAHEPSVTQAALDAAWEALTIWVPDSHTKANALELIGKARAELTKGTEHE